MKTFKTRNAILTNMTYFDVIAQGFREKLLKEMDEFQGKGSGWVLEGIIALEVRLNVFNPLGGSFSTNCVPDPSPVTGEYVDIDY